MAKKPSALSKLDRKHEILNTTEEEKAQKAKAQVEEVEAKKAVSKERKQNSPLNRIKRQNVDSTKPDSEPKKLTDNENGSKSTPDGKNPLAKDSKRNTAGDMPDIDYEKFEQEVDAYDLLEARRKRKQERNAEIRRKILSVALILGCVYMIFLIYGVANTRYVYNDEGQVAAQRLSVQDIRNVGDFEAIASEYYQARIVYEKVLMLDYRIAAGVEDPLVVAPDYEKELDEIEKLVIQIQAFSPASKYTQVHTMLQSWATNDIAIYCQRMSEAISQNNSAYAEQALEYKSIVYNDFSLITENLTTLGKTVNGVDVSDLMSWSPEGYIRDNVGALDGGIN